MRAGIDIGNTRSKLGLYHDENQIQMIMLERSHQAIVRAIQDYEIEHLIVSTVADELVDDIEWMKGLNTFITLSPYTALPVGIDYTTPETLGQDRLALAVGANHLYGSTGQPSLIIDAGTCITMDVLDDSSCFLGGSISPGINMRLRAMHNFTASLPLVQLEEWDGPIGKSTDEALLLGAAQGVVCEILGFIELLEDSFKKLNVILTGGDGALIAKKLQRKIFLHPELLHIGLREILNFNAD